MADELDEIDALESAEEKLLAYGRLAASTDDPKVALEAKVGEIQEARHLGRQQHAVVAGTELVGLLERWPPTEDLPERVAWGLKYAVGAALDIPEIPLETVDHLLALLEQVLARQRKQPYAAWQLALRRAYVTGDPERVRELVSKLAPHVSRTSHFRHDLDCPGCSLAQFAEYLGPDASPDLLETVLEPILSGRLTYRNEDPDLVRILSLLYGEQESCANGLVATHARYARALARAGRTGEARRHLAQAEGYRDSEVSAAIWIAALELALATGEPDALRAAADDAVDALRRHEDVNEACELAGLAARALARLGDPRAEEVGAHALALAQRLDARLPVPRHVEAVRRSAPGC